MKVTGDDTPTYVISREDWLLQKVEHGILDDLAKKKTVDGEDAEFVFGQNSIYAQLRDNAGVWLDGPEHRFEVLSTAGAGATATVFKARDNNIDREVAVKLLKGRSKDSIEGFIKEAQTAARLDHPNIVPIYDINVGQDGNICLTMKHIEGYTLKDYLADKKANHEDFHIKSDGDLVQVMLKVCDALEYAHSQDRVHQDIKPENIMIGSYGEVFLIDWGSSSYNQEYFAVTPTYMSPQQSAGDIATATDDVYCLGATFFHCLTGRFPTVADNFDELWEKRRKGIVDKLSDQERASVSAPLLAIVEKALAFDVKDRYQTISELARDLKDYQSGLAISAYRDSFLGYLARYYRRHTRTIWLVAAIAILLGIFGWYIYDQKLKEMAFWGAPVFVENFDDDSWRGNWYMYKGNWTRQNGRIVTTKGAGAAYFLVYKQRVDGSTAIEFEGEMLPGSQPCDLSVVWYDDIELDASGKTMVDNGGIYLFQTGAFNNTCAMILHERSFRLDYSDFKLKEGHKYKIRVEIDGKRLSLFVDGEKICQAEVPFAFDSGYIGLYGYYADKAFDNIRIYSKGVPQKVSVIKVGDTLFKNQQYVAAAAEYEQVVRSHPGTALAEEATFKQGLSLYRQGKIEAAFEVWRGLREKRFKLQIEGYRWLYMYRQGDAEAVHREMDLVFGDSSASDARIHEEAWRWVLKEAREELDIDAMRWLIKIHQRYFSDSHVNDFMIASILLDIGDYEKVVKEYANEEMLRGIALKLMGRYDEIFETCQALRPLIASYYLETCRFDEVAKNTPQSTGQISLAMYFKGELDEVIKRFPERRGAVLALLEKGRTEEVLSKFRKDPWATSFALLQQGKTAEVVKLTDKEAKLDGLRRWAQYQQAYNDLAEGRSDIGRLELAALNREQFLYRYWTFLIDLNFVFPVFINAMEHGDSKALFRELMKKHVYHFQRRIWYRAAFLAGEITEEQFLDQPHKLNTKADLMLLKAMKYELEMETEKAVAAYDSYLALPVHQRGFSPATDEFIRWRKKEIAEKE